MVERELRTACGKLLRLEAASIESAYLGHLEGSSRAAMQRIIDQAALRHPWGPQFPTHMLPTDIGEHGKPGWPPRFSLPRWLVLAQLAASWTGEHRDAHGTHLTLGFFTNDAFDQPLSALLPAAVAQIDWEALAEPFEF